MKIKLKKVWNKFIFLLFKDDSLKGWLFSIVFVFLFIRFVFFPGLSLITGTALPIAIVESCSMFHDGNLFSDYEEWFERNKEKYSGFGIDKEEFLEFPFKKGINKGDILFVTGVKPKNIEVGDVIIFNANHQNPIIHRVVNRTERNGELVFSTWGDNNKQQGDFEKAIGENQLVGKSTIKLAPYLGWIKLVFFEIVKKSHQRGFCVEEGNT